jgi:tRNA A-37 threonylcarbamoyl transferase component Bud32
MPVMIQCPNPNCARSSSVADDVVGRGVRCRHCGTRFTASDSSANLGPKATRPSGSKSTAPGASGPHTPVRASFSSAGAPPASIARFQIRDRLGSGAAGAVFRAYDPQLDREVAIKMPQPGTLDSPKRVERFLREARSAARLRHANIVPVYEAGQDGDTYFIASAFVPGKPLSAAIPEKGMAPKRAARLLRDICAAVAYAHDEGIVHRDIKPANVMLDADDNPHLMDFGLAARNDEDNRLTQDGAILGTPAYMAPEMAGGQQGEAKPAADQYSLGVMLYELLTGRAPFDGPPAIVLYNAIHTEPARPSELRERIPDDLEAVCLKAMAKDPADRYTTVQAMANDLARWLNREPVEAEFPASGRSGPADWVKANPRLAAAAAAAALTVVGLSVALVVVLAQPKPHVAALPSAPPIRADEPGPADANPVPPAQQPADDRPAKPARPVASPPKPAPKAVQPNEYSVQVPADEEPPRGALVREFRGHGDWAACVAITADGKQVLAGGYDTTVRVWDTATGEQIKRLTGHGDAVLGVAASRDGGLIASVERWKGPHTRGLRLWDRDANFKFTALPGQSAVAFTPAGDRFACAAADLDDATGLGIQHRGGSRSGDYGQSVYVWDDHGGWKYTLERAADRVRSLAFNAGGTLLATGGERGQLRVARLANAPDGIEYEELGLGETIPVHSTPILSVAFAPAGDRLVSCDTSGTVALWDPATQGLVWRSEAHTKAAMSVAISPDGRWVASAGIHAAEGGVQDYGEVRLLSTANKGKRKYVLRGHDKLVRAVTFATVAGKQVLATASYDGTVKLWDLAKLLAAGEAD